MKRQFSFIIGLIVGFSIHFLYASICSASNIVVELAQLSIEDLMQVTVSSVGFFDLPPEQAPGSIQILTTQQIEDSPAIGLADVLDLYVSGIHVGNSNKNGASYAVRGMRMPDNSTTVFMFDGQNINTGAGLGGNMNLDLPLLGDISQLEVIKGPCALVHGSGAMNGFVNIIPKNGSENSGYYYHMQYGFKENLAKLENGYGFSYGHDKDVFLYLGTVYAEGFDSQETYGFNNSTQHSDADHCRFFDPSIRLSLNWRHNDFHLTTLFQKDRGSNNVKYTDSKNPLEYYHGMFLASLSWESQITPYEEFEWHIPISFYDFGLIYPSLNNSRKISEEGASECHIENRFVFKTHRIPKHSIAIGGLIGSRHIRAGDYYLNQNTVSEGSLLDSDWEEFGFFSEDVFHLSQKWHFSFGFRYDILDNKDFKIPEFFNENQKQTDTYEQESKDVSTTRIAASYNMTPQNTFKLSFQEGYHNPNPVYYYEIFYGRNNSQKDLKPELMSSLEFSYQHSKPELGLQLGVNLFLNSYENSLLVKTEADDPAPSELLSGKSNSPDNGNQPGDGKNFNDIFSNGPSFASMGGEIDLDWQINSQIDIFFSYAYTRPKDVEEEENIRVLIANGNCSQWLSYPTHIFKGAIRQKAFNDRLSVNVHGTYSSAIDARTTAPNKSSQYYPPGVNVHASLSIKFSDQLTFQVIGRNIFDNDHPPVGFYYLEPWDGNLGEDSPLVYIGLTWKE
ncbi:MAG: TonB-dependent receptor [Candidatus Magnetomorum sp.]|nr:TonB-dependent receptor [Candidatus Magnetomorum sp.]